MCKPSIQRLKEMPHLGNFPLLSNIYFLVSSFTVWNAGTELVLQTNMSSGVGSNKAWPNFSERIWKWK